MPWLPEGLVFDYVFFVGGGATRDKQLSLYFQSRALLHARNDRADNEDKLTFTIKSFHAEVCQRLKLVDLWQKHLHRKFGAVATSSEAVNKLVEHLTTKPGLLKVQECIAHSVPCHGNGGAESGIAECRVLYHELERCKAGGLPPPAVQPDLTAAPLAHAANLGGVDPSQSGAERVVALAEENLRFALGDPLREESDRPDGVTQREYELFLKSKAYMDGVSFAKDSGDFKEAATQLMKHGRTIHVIDLSTSRKAQISVAVEMMGSLVSGSDRARILTLLMSRTDILFDVEKKLKTVLPSWYHVLLTMQGKTNFKPGYNKAGPGHFLYLSVPNCDKLQEFRTTIKYSPRPGPGEKLRVLCTNTNCPFRNLGGGGPSEAEGKFSE